jgi:uncharacterized protein (UPF0333 family)
MLKKGYSMKNLMKYTLIVLLAASVAAPVMAAETTKGTKSYQARAEKPDADAANAQTPETAQDMQDIAPAAGAEDESAPAEKNGLRDDMRLPRKN